MCREFMSIRELRQSSCGRQIRDKQVYNRRKGPANVSNGLRASRRRLKGQATVSNNGNEGQNKVRSG